MGSRGKRQRFGLIGALLVNAALAVDPRAAQAEDPKDAPQAADAPVVSPRAVETKEATYPEGATGSASVLVEVVVETDGSVSNVAIVQGDEPFATAAKEAIGAWRFTPAMRAGKPLRARIRIGVAFSPPEPEPPPPGPDAPPNVVTGPSSAPPPSTQAKIEEVFVLGRNDLRTPTEHRLGRAEIRMIPGAFGDPFRAIDSLPGVVPIVSGLPYFYIRGAPPSAVGYYVDEVRVPYLFHFGLGPSVIQPSLIEEVSLHPAAFPARFGRFAGGIVAGQTRDPSKELTGEGQVRIFDAGAYVEAPFAEGRGSAGVGGRYSYTAGIISLVAPDTTVDYRDYNARVSYDLSDRTRLSAFAFGAYDYTSTVEDEEEKVLFASEFHRLDVRLDHRGDGGSFTRVATTVGIDRTRIEGARFAQDIMVGVRARHRTPITKNLDFEIGADVQTDFYKGDLPSPYAVSRDDYDRAKTFFAPRTESASGAWVSATYRPFNGWEIVGTARGDVFTSAGKALVGPSPRLSMRVPIVPKVAFLAALGVAPQPPAFPIPVPAIGYSGLPGGLGYGYQKSAGVEVGLPLNFLFKAVGYHHTYLKVRDFSRDRENLEIDEAQPAPPSPSQAYGLEVSLKRKLSERFAAFTSFTLSRSEVGSTQRQPARVSPFDRTYVFQIGGVADLGAGWHVSSRFLTYRGWPDQENALITSGRLSPFLRIDVRLEKRWTFQKARYISLVFEGLNVTASKEVVGTKCDANVCRDDTLGPIVIPSIGVEGGL